MLQERLNLLERLEQRPLKVRPKEDYERIVCGLSNAELESMIDLRPFMQRNPFVIQADANLSRTYRLFRTMGLRHLFVGPPQPKVSVVQVKLCDHSSQPVKSDYMPCALCCLVSSKQAM